MRVGVPLVRQHLCSSAAVSSESLHPAVGVTVLDQQSHHCPFRQEGPTWKLALLGQPGCWELQCVMFLLPLAFILFQELMDRTFEERPLDRSRW